MYVNKSLIIIITIYLIYWEHGYFSFRCLTPSDEFNKFNSIIGSVFLYNMDKL